MDTQSFARIWSVAINADQIFRECHDQASTMVGTHGTSAVTIDCLKSQQRLGIAQAPDTPGVITLFRGEKGGGMVETLKRCSIAAFDTREVLQVMEQCFFTGAESASEATQ